jgi:4-amino-4-deoxy-L-arabinose transferase-like glycosyltransferase
LFAFFWFACVFGFFTIAVTKLPSYVLPLMPAAAILVALLWSEQMAQPIQPSWGIKLSSILNGLFFLVVAGVLIYTPQLVKNDRAMPNLAPLLQQSGLPILGGLIAIATTALVWLLLLRRQTRWVWLANVVGALLLIVFVLVPATSIVDSQRQLPLRQLAQIAVEKRLPGEELIMIGEKKPSVVFYTRQPVTFKLRSKTAVTHLREKAATQSNAPTTLILTAPDRLPAIGLQPNQYQTLGKAGPYELVRIPKDVLPQLPSQ